MSGPVKEETPPPSSSRRWPDGCRLSNRNDYVDAVAGLPLPHDRQSVPRSSELFQAMVVDHTHRGRQRAAISAGHDPCGGLEAGLIAAIALAVAIAVLGMVLAQQGAPMPTGTFEMSSYVMPG
jgi:hypothetical protein